MAPSKKSGPAKASKSTKSKTRSIGFPAPIEPLKTAIPPSRAHQSPYHYPLLLQDRETCGMLLHWFKGVEETRSMPWRKQWINPNDYVGKEQELGKVLSKRSYEVWISEVMLQQTRVSTVIPYFKNWIEEWPTVEDLAEANHDDVLSAWKGLGYYSRATRLHEGAKVVMAKTSTSPCRIPSKASDLQDLPGIGRYTAGAISSIVFGEAEPVLDGNVARVLSRQLGIYADAKDKSVSDVLWDEADRLIKHVANLEEGQTSEVPGLWNQALMELGSTICTPRPQCNDCPLQSTCRAYIEGKILSEKTQSATAVLDIEDVCQLCESLDTEDLVMAPDDVEGEEEETSQPSKKRKVVAKQTNTLSQYFAIRTTKSEANLASAKEAENDAKKRRLEEANEKAFKSITAYCALFPKKVAKKKAAEEESMVCLIELCVAGKSSKWLIEQRPAKGLLASLWQFPQSTLPASSTTASDRKAAAQNYIESLKLGEVDTKRARYVADFPSFVHVFTHLRLTMHTYHFQIKIEVDQNLNLELAGTPARKWVDGDDMEGETLSTGMRRCWQLLQ